MILHDSLCRSLKSVGVWKFGSVCWQMIKDIANEILGRDQLAGYTRRTLREGDFSSVGISSK